MAGLFEAFLQLFTTRGITEFFLLVILTVFIWFLYSTRGGDKPNLAHHAPTLLTTLGILGTFTGVLLGLLEFDPVNIDESIETLLSGLKIAFMTSVAGMLTGILYKGISLTSGWQPVEIQGDISDIGPGHILKSLDAQTELLKSTRDAIASSEESSLAGQLKLLRTDLNDQQRRDEEAREKFSELISKHLEEFADMLSRSATEQVIEALKQVIVDFNRNLTEQFGDNFKALDASVQKLVEWQEHYREQLQKLHELYDTSVEGIQTAETAIKNIEETATSIPATMERLSSIMETANHQLSELERHLTVFAELRDRAVQAVPQVQEQVTKMTDEVTASANLVKERNQQLLAESDSYIKEQTRLGQEMLKTLTSAGELTQRDTQTIQQQVANNIQQMTEQLESALTKSLTAQNETLNQSAEGFLEQMRKSITRTEESLNAELKAFDEARQQELERVINEMARALGQIAGKFTEDYSRLVSKMDAIIRKWENR